MKYQYMKYTVVINHKFISFSAVQIYDISYIHLHVCFLFAILGLILHKTWQNTKGGSVCMYNLQIETTIMQLMHMVNEDKIIDVQGQGPSNINLSLFFVSFNHSPH